MSRHHISNCQSLCQVCSRNFRLIFVENKESQGAPLGIILRTRATHEAELKNRKQNIHHFLSSENDICDDMLK